MFAILSKSPMSHGQKSKFNMVEPGSDNPLKGPPTQDVQATMKESATIVARANAHLSTFQRLMDGLDEPLAEDEPEEDGERNFNAVSETA
jgi:hypothetical protein